MSGIKCPKCGCETPGMVVYCSGRSAQSHVEGAYLRPMCESVTIVGGDEKCPRHEHLRVKCTCGFCWDREPLDKSRTGIKITPIKSILGEIDR